MSKCTMYNRMSAKDWAWGTTAYWKICSNLRVSLSPSRWKSSRSKPRKKACCVTRHSLRGAHVRAETGEASCFVAGRGRFSCTFQDRLNHYTDCSKMKHYSSLGSKQLRKFLSSSCIAFNLDEQRQDALSSIEIDEILRGNERTFSDFLMNNVSFCATNQLSSNQPMEDQVILATCNDGRSLLAGVIDGHGGFKFGEVVQKRLPFYISAAVASEGDAPVLRSKDSLEALVSILISNEDSQTDLADEPYWLARLDAFVEDLRAKKPSEQSYISLVSNPLRQLFGTEMFGDYADTDIASNAKSLIQEAFLRLDDDLLTELSEQAVNNETLKAFHKGLSTSGCCALMVFLRDNDLYVANSGDCRAVLGTLNNGIITAVQLSQDHTAVSNPDEVARILMEHPQNESRTCIQYGRLLGRLAPLRAFGDIQFKLTAEKQQEIMSRHSPSFKAMQSVKTPPYLTAQPDVSHYHLQTNDQFVILASDGLWDMLSNEEVVWLVDGFLRGKGVDLLKDKAILHGMCPDSMLLKDLDDVIDRDNVATFLIRYALGGANQHALSAMLTLPHPEVRMYRDDITVVVVKLDNNVSIETPTM